MFNPLAGTTLVAEQDNLATVVAAVAPHVIWAAFAAFALHALRDPLERLLDRSQKFSVKDWVTIEARQPDQQATDKPLVYPASAVVGAESLTASDEPALAAAATPLFDALGFLTPAGVEAIVRSDKDGTRVLDDGVLLLFHTARQRTHLVATNEALYCVLQDVRRGQGAGSIQWRLTYAEDALVRTRPYSELTGMLDVGRHRDWLYSIALHPEPDRLEDAVRLLIERGRAADAANGARR